MKPIAVILLVLLVTATAGAVEIWGVDNLGTTNAGTIGDRIIKFDSASPATPVVVGATGIANTLMSGLDFGADGHLYAYAQSGSIGLYEINRTTGAATFIGSGGLVAGDIVTDLSYARSVPVMYAIGQGTGGLHLYTINTTTGVATLLGAITGAAGSLDVGLATDASGTNFMLDLVSDGFYKLAGLAATFLGPEGFDSNFSQGATFDVGTGVLYHGALNQASFRCELWTVNTTTGAGTLVGNIGPVNASGLPEYETGDIAIAPPEQADFILSGTALGGVGQETATILYDTLSGPQKKPGGPGANKPAGGMTQASGQVHSGGASPSPLGGTCLTTTTKKGSVLIYPKVELRYDAAGNLLQDTFVSLNNDNTCDVHVVVFFRTDDAACTIGYTDIDLTKNEATYWSAATGLPKGVAPLGTFVAPYPDPDGSPDFVLRGYLVVIATDILDAQINFNHLYGGATLVRYDWGTAWEYNAYSFRALIGATGDVVGTPGEVKLDGINYDTALADLLLDFVASGSHAFSGGGLFITHDTDVTLVIADMDLRQDHCICPPITKAKYYIWNENEVSYTAEYCLSRCGFDESLLSGHGGAFLIANLHTDKGRARIAGIKSIVCDTPTCLSDNHALLGTAVKVMALQAADGNHP